MHRKKFNDKVKHIGENTQWDVPLKSPNAGKVIPKPPTSLRPKDDGDGKASS